MSSKRVTKVEFLPKIAPLEIKRHGLKRVAAYARVSTNKEEQQTSIEAQKDYYTNFIQSHKDWEFVGVYADEGVTGTNINKREQFKRLIADCKEGKIDMVLSKSISRFGRNTVDTLEAIRLLKSFGIGVYFDKENVWTLDSKGEFIITLMSSLAQEESRSMSENVTWAHRKRFAKGLGSFAYSRVLGLDKGDEKFEIVVNREQAQIVCRIFRMFFQGLTPHTIAGLLTKAGYPSPGGKEKWNSQTVRRMLGNEKYKGAMLLQKQFTVDFLKKKVKKNEGELPMYYVEDNHEAIIEPWLFDYVQTLLQERARTSESRYSGVYPFSSKLICAKCGRTFGIRPWHSSSYNYLVWQCRGRFAEDKCITINIYNKVLFYVLHQLLQQKIVDGGIGEMLSKIIKKKIRSQEQLEQVKAYIQHFSEMSPWDLLSDADDLTMLMDKVMVYDDRTIKVHWRDGNVDELRIPEFKSSRGIISEEKDGAFIPYKKSPRNTERRCLNCHDVIVGGRLKYCSDSCKKEWYKKQAAVRRCKYCRKILTKKTQKIYCSQECCINDRYYNIRNRRRKLIVRKL